MRTGSSPARAAEAFGDLFGDQLKAELIMYYKKNGSWLLFEDLDEEAGVKWGAAGQKFDYSNIGLVPGASNVAFSVVNLLGQYSPGSGTAYDNVLDIDTPIKLQAGYILPDLGDEISDNMALGEGAFGYHFYTKTVDGVVIPDASNSVGNTDKYFTDLFGLYGDGVTYGDSHYGPAGYIVSTYGFSKQGLNQTNNIQVTANNTSFRIFWRTFNDRSTADQNPIKSTDWTSAGFTVNGTKLISINQDTKYIQVAVLFDGIAWSDGANVSAITIQYQSFVEWIYKSVYYLDSAEFDDPTAPQIPRVQCAGRDLMKRAIDTDFNLPDLTAGFYVDALVKLILDGLQMKYTPTSIADLSAFGQRTLATGLNSQLKANKVLELAMQIITQSGSTKYFAFMRYDESIDDNAFFIQPKPIVFTDFMTFSRNYVTSIGFKRKSYDRLLQRISAFTKKESQSPNVVLASQLITSSGVVTLSWIGNAESKYFSVDVLDSFSDVALSGTHPVNPTSIDFLIIYSGTPFTLTVYGSMWSASAPVAEGESINAVNMRNRRGITREIENPLILDSTEARAVAEGFTETYGDPQFDVGDLQFPFLNVFFDQNDPALIVSDITFIATIYYINAIQNFWSRSPNPADATTFSLIDSGFELSDFPDIIRYDGIGRYDSGIQYDLNFPLNQTEDTTDYSYLEPVKFS